MSKTADKTGLEDLLTPGQSGNQMVATAYARDPYFFDFKRELGNLGDYVSFRVINNDDRFVITLPAIKAAKKNTKTNEVYKDQIIILPEGDEWKKYTDALGTKLVECKVTEVRRFVVFVTGKQAAKKGTKAMWEDINKLMYFNLPQNMVIAYNNLNKQGQGTYPWNNETGLPEYDIQILAVQGNNGMKNYSMVPELIDINAATPQAHRHFKQPVKDVIGDYINVFKDEHATALENALTKPSMNQFLFELGISTATTSTVSEAVAKATTLDDIIG
jgi:hypothetical protein